MLLQVLLVYIVLSLPFDLLGGWLLPARYGKLQQGLVSYLRKWGGRGVTVQGAGHARLCARHDRGDAARGWFSEPAACCWS